MLLTLAAGCVDTVAYIGLDVFPANMTGNTVLLGLALGRAQGVAVAHAAVALAGFLGGAALGALIAGSTASAAVWPRSVSVAFAVEWALLAALAGVWSAAGDLLASQPAVWALIALSALAMGLQSAVAVRLGVPGVATTYITGTLTNLTLQLVGRARGAAPGAPPAATAPPKTSSSLLAATWLMYVLGAALAALTFPYGPLIALGFPLAMLTVVLIVGAARLHTA